MNYQPLNDYVLVKTIKEELPLNNTANSAPPSLVVLDWFCIIVPTLIENLTLIMKWSNLLLNYFP